MTNMCMCVILLLFRLAPNMFMNNILIIAKKRLDLTNLRMEMYPVEGPMLSPTHGELLKVVDHSRCRKMYAVQSLEHPPGSKRSEEEEDDVGSH